MSVSKLIALCSSSGAKAYTIALPAPPFVNRCPDRCEATRLDGQVGDPCTANAFKPCTALASSLKLAMLMGLWVSGLIQSRGKSGCFTLPALVERHWHQNHAPSSGGFSSLTDVQACSVAVCEHTRCSHHARGSGLCQEKAPTHREKQEQTARPKAIGN